MTLCPVQTIQLQAATLGGEMLRSLRRLRLEIAACQTCFRSNDCTARDELDAQIETAINEIAAEWELTTCSNAR